nr:hypothetical protein [Tanacetum cinerariifolium]
AVQIQTDRLRDSYQRENDEFLCTIAENMKRIIKEQVKSQVKEQVSKILPRIEQSVNAQLEAELLTRSSHPSRTSYVVAADLSEMELKKILINKMEGNNLTELEYHLEEVYKATMDQLDWVNPKGQQYPHNLLQPLPLIPGTEVAVSFHLHTSSTMTSSIFGEFYGFTVNRESTLDVYSKRRIIAVTDLKIVEWHN